MTLEFILWITAWVVISEILFIIWCLRDNGYSVFSWVTRKFLSFAIGGVFIFIQGGVVFGDGGKVALFGTVPHYINLLYEVIVLGIVGSLFLCNWLISRKIKERKKKGKK